VQGIDREGLGAERVYVQGIDREGLGAERVYVQGIDREGLGTERVSAPRGSRCIVGIRSLVGR